MKKPRHIIFFDGFFSQFIQITEFNFDEAIFTSGLDYASTLLNRLEKLTNHYLETIDSHSAGKNDLLSFMFSSMYFIFETPSRIKSKLIFA